MDKWPDFFIVGAPKAGSTSLFRYLEQHPDIFLPRIKEPHYFCPDTARAQQIEYVSSEQSYLELFAGAGATQLCGEASVIYLRAPEAPERLHQQVPNAKIIILLREPGDRAFSHYLMRWRGGGIQISFSDGLTNQAQEEADYCKFNQFVLEPGFYARQIPRYVDLFGRENVKIIITDDFFANPRSVVNDTLAFLGIDSPIQLEEFARHNDYVAPRGKLSLLFLQNKHHLRFLKPLVPAQLKWQIVRKFFNRPAEKPKISPEERTALTNIYRNDVEQLRTYLNLPDLWSNTYADEQHTNI